MLSLQFAYFVDGHDIRMLQAGRRFGFQPESLDERLAGEGAGQDHFQRDDAIQTPVPRLIDDAYAASGDLFQQFVVAEAAEGFVIRDA